MSHFVTGFVIPANGLAVVLTAQPKLKPVTLEQGFVLFPLPEDLIDSIFPSSKREPLVLFQYLDDHLFPFLSALSRSCSLVYFETEYFGGTGAQVAITLENGVVVFGPVEERTDGPNSAISLGNSPISQALRRLGVTKAPEDHDEFDALGLHRWRDSSEWLSAENETL